MKPKMEMTHKPHYATALQMAKKFVAKEDFRPVLQMVCHRPDGSLVATDSRRLLLVRDVHGFADEWLVNPKTFELAKGEYPDIAKIVPEPKEPNFILNATQAKAWEKAHKAMHDMMGKDDYPYAVKLHTYSNEFYIRYEGVTMSLPSTSYTPPVFDEMKYDASFMVDALHALQKLGVEEIKISLYDPHEPILLESENALALILPVRINFGKTEGGIQTNDR